MRNTQKAESFHPDTNTRRRNYNPPHTLVHRIMSQMHTHRMKTSPDTQYYIDLHRNTVSHTESQSDMDTPSPTPPEVTPQMSQHTELWCLPRQDLYGGLEISGFQSQHGWSSPFPSPSLAQFPPGRAQVTPWGRERSDPSSPIAPIWTGHPLTKQWEVPSKRGLNWVERGRSFPVENQK